MVTLLKEDLALLEKVLRVGVANTKAPADTKSGADAFLALPDLTKELEAEAAGSAVSSAGPSAYSGSEGPPAGFFVTLVVGAVVLCAILCCLRRLIRTGADHLHRQQAARHSPMRDEGAQQQRASIAANIVASLTPHIAATAAQELCAVAEEEQLNPTGDADDGTSTVFSARESDAIM